MSFLLRKKEFKSGLKLVYQQNPLAHKSIFQVYVNVGSLIEDKKSLGICHLVEHLMFKSTKTKTTEEISVELEKCGANINAYTTFDTTCFHYISSHKNFKKCMEIFADMILNKNISEEEFEKEKEVVIQEYYMYQDQPDAVNISNYYERFYKWKDIIGEVDVLKEITLEDVNNFIQQNYILNNMTISIISNKPYLYIKKLVKDLFNADYKHWNVTAVINDINKDYATNKWDSLKLSPVNYANKTVKIEKETAQVQIMTGYPLKVDNIMELDYINFLLSKGLSSILYRHLREKKGLFYGCSVVADYFFNVTVNNKYGTGLNIISSTDTLNVNKYITSLKKLMKELKTVINEDDVERVNNQIVDLKYSLFGNATYNAFYFSKKNVPTYANIIKKLGKLKLEDVRTLLDSWFNNFDNLKANTMMLGNFNKK